MAIICVYTTSREMEILFNRFFISGTENAESMQVLRYEIGQKYDAHFDYFHDKMLLRLGGHRVATVLMYLTDVKRGRRDCISKR
jgi:hypothetical protein